MSIDGDSPQSLLGMDNLPGVKSATPSKYASYNTSYRLDYLTNSTLMPLTRIYTRGKFK